MRDKSTPEEKISLPVHVELSMERHGAINGKLKVLMRQMWRIEAWVVAGIFGVVTRMLGWW